MFYSFPSRYSDGYKNELNHFLDVVQVRRSIFVILDACYYSHFPGRRQDERYLEDDQRRVQDRGRRRGVRQVRRGRQDDLGPGGAAGGFQLLNYNTFEAFCNSS